MAVLTNEETIETSSEAPICVPDNYNQDLTEPMAEESSYQSGNDSGDDANGITHPTAADLLH